MNIYAADRLAIITGVRNLPYMLNHKISGYLSFFCEPGKSSNYAKLVCGPHHYVLSYMSDGEGHEIAFKRKDDVFEPVFIRKLMAEAQTMDVGECNVTNRQMRCYKRNAQGTDIGAISPRSERVLKPYVAGLVRSAAADLEAEVVFICQSVNNVQQVQARSIVKSEVKINAQKAASLNPGELESLARNNPLVIEF